MSAMTRLASGAGVAEKDSPVNVEGKAVRDTEVLARIKKLAIPPAWKNVWICPYENGHIQATGTDDKRPKQYRYHERWRAVRDETKYTRMMAFGAALPRIRCKLKLI